MYRLLILKGAALDLKESTDWYDLKQKGLGKRFQKYIFQTLENIQSNPFLYPVKFSETFRFAKVNVFPFFVVFEVVENSILVNSIFHTSRKPSQF